GEWGEWEGPAGGQPRPVPGALEDAQEAGPRPPEAARTRDRAAAHDQRGLLRADVPGHQEEDGTYEQQPRLDDPGVRPRDRPPEPRHGGVRPEHAEEPVREAETQGEGKAPPLTGVERDQAMLHVVDQLDDRLRPAAEARAGKTPAHP